MQLPDQNNTLFSEAAHILGSYAIGLTGGALCAPALDRIFTRYSSLQSFEGPMLKPYGISPAIRYGALGVSLVDALSNIGTSMYDKARGENQDGIEAAEKGSISAAIGIGGMVLSYYNLGPVSSVATTAIGMLSPLISSAAVYALNPHSLDR